MSRAKEMLASGVAKLEERRAAAKPPPKKDMPEITAWRKIVSDGEDPHWFVTVRGSNREMRITDVRDIAEYRRFKYQCISQLSMHFLPVEGAQKAWEMSLMVARQLMTEEQAPEETTPKGYFRELLETYLTNKQRAARREDLLGNRPWENEDKDCYEFTMRGLTNFLSRQRPKLIVTSHQIGNWIKELGGRRISTSVRQKSVHLWLVPTSAVQKPPMLPTPDIVEKPM